jgi:hypothetical protein
MERNARLRLQMAGVAMITDSRDELAIATFLLFGRTLQQ